MTLGDLWQIHPGEKGSKKRQAYTSRVSHYFTNKVEDHYVSGPLQQVSANDVYFDLSNHGANIYIFIYVCVIHFKLLKVKFPNFDSDTPVEHIKFERRSLGDHFLGLQNFSGAIH